VTTTKPAWLPRKRASIIAFALATLALAAHAAAPTPPAQPTHGPGSSDYAHARVDAREFAPGARGGWIFTPAVPLPKTAPVVVFCHGWGALDPHGYRGWIDHLVRRGAIVVWPNYQDSLRVRGADFLPNALAGIHAAFAQLAAPDAPVAADFSRLAIVGHSAGGLLSAEIAAAAAAEHLPPFRAVMPVQPGDGSRDGTRPATIPTADIASLPASTLLLVLVGADDRFAFEQLGLRLYDAARALPAQNKNVLELRTDRHGSPALVANHFAPAAPAAARAPRAHALSSDFEHAGAIDAMDWYGTWKLFDALSDAAFYGRERDVALGGGEAQTFMGTWSDGVAVTPMRVLR